MLQQISVFVTNQIGAVLKVTQALKDGQFNIRAFSVYDTPEFSILRLIFDDAEEVTAYLAEQGFFVKASSVVGVVLEDKPGYLNGILEATKEAEIQVNYMYSLVLRANAKPVMIMHTDQDARLEEVLRAAGCELV